MNGLKGRSRFLTLLFSIVPGAGQMYLGFMKQGMTVMFLFFFTIFLVDFFRVSFIAAFLPVIWCYGFFDTINKARLSSEELSALEDKSIIEDILSNRFKVFLHGSKWLGIVLISLGVLLLIDNIILQELARLNVNYYRIREYMRTLIAAGIMIILGVKLIAGKKGTRSEEGGV